MTSYFCHECQRRVTVNDALQCNHCRGEFVEEMVEREEIDNEQPPDDTEADDEDEGEAHSGYFVRQNNDGSGGTIVIEGVNPLMALLATGRPFGRLLGQVGSMQSATPSTSNTAPNANPNPNNIRRNPSGARMPVPNDNFSQFLNQLLANLAQGTNEGGTRLTFHFNNDNNHNDGGGGFFQAIHGNFNDYAWGEGGLDAIVTQLLNQFETNQAEGVSADDLIRLPISEVDDKQVENGTQCTTCMETFNKGEKVARLDCQHIFHRSCIEPWLVKHNTCPICRQTVDPKKWGPEQRITDIDELD